MDHEDIRLSEISQAQEDQCCIIPLIWVTGIVKLIEAGSRKVVARSWGEGGMGSHCLMGPGSPFEKIKRFWRWMMVFTQQCDCKHNSVTVFNASELDT